MVIVISHLSPQPKEQDKHTESKPQYHNSATLVGYLIWIDQT